VLIMHTHIGKEKAIWCCNYVNWDRSKHNSNFFCIWSIFKLVQLQISVHADIHTPYHIREVGGGGGGG
jgi:hypothetical protein